MSHLYLVVLFPHQFLSDWTLEILLHHECGELVG